MQNAKKIVIFIAAAFFVAVAVSFVTVFSVKQVYAEFSVFGADDCAEIQKELDVFKGRNLIFLNEQDVYSVAEDHPYYEIVSAEKVYPNLLKVRVKKREEAFTVGVSGRTFVIDADGYVLNDTGVTEGKTLDFDIGNLTVTGCAVGGKIETSSDGLFYSVLSMAKSVKLSDYFSAVSLGTSGLKDVVLLTKTGVKIRVDKPEISGAEKLAAALNFYDNASDYQKIFNEIMTVQMDNGVIRPAWTEN